MLYADDLVLMSETIEALRNTFFKWMEAFESKGFNVDIWKAKVDIWKTKVDIQTEVFKKVCMQKMWKEY